MSCFLPKFFLIKSIIFAFKMDPNKEFQDNLNVFNKLVQDLASCNIKFPNEKLVVILLNSLPDCFKSLINVIECARDTLTKEIVINVIRAHDFKAKMRE